MESIKNIKDKYSRYRGNGFTLIELMMVIAIVAIIAAISIPSYHTHIKNTHRKNTMAEMLDLVGSLEQGYSANNAYLGAQMLGLMGGAGPIQFPSNAPRYNINIRGVTIAAGGGGGILVRTEDIAPVDGARYAGYQVIATPIPNGSNANDRCGELEINEQGIKTAKVDGHDIDSCW